MTSSGLQFDCKQVPAVTTRVVGQYPSRHMGTAAPSSVTIPVRAARDVGRSRLEGERTKHVGDLMAGLEWVA